MAATPKPVLVKCECGQVVARIVGKTIKPLADISIRRGHISAVCPACGKRIYLTRATLEDAA